MKLLISFIVVVILGVGVLWYQKISSQGQNNQNQQIIPSVTEAARPSNVPPLTEESFIRTFFAEIHTGEIPSAVSRLSKKNIPDNSAKQAWATQFDAMDAVKVLAVEPYGATASRMYKVTLEVAMFPESASAPIPYYGWDSNPSVRWITIVTEDGFWKIDGIATGP